MCVLSSGNKMMCIAIITLPVQNSCEGKIFHFQTLFTMLHLWHVSHNLYIAQWSYIVSQYMNLNSSSPVTVWYSCRPAWGCDEQCSLSVHQTLSRTARDRRQQDRWKTPSQDRHR